MKTFRNTASIRCEAAPVVLTLGNFDGVHAGHRRVIGEVVRRARALGGRAAVLTFVPHTQSVLSAGRAFKVLTLPCEKEALLNGLSVDCLIFLPFNAALRGLTARQFFSEIILKTLHPSEIILGHDHRFGSGRGGGFTLMKELCAAHNIRVVRIPPCRRQGKVISSTLIRELLEMGKMEAVAGLMEGGYPVMGKVVKGRGLGGKLGFPTANIAPHPQKRLPPDGVYHGTVRVGAREYRALVSLGSRPTFGGGRRVLEAHLLDFHGNLYGKNIILNILGFIRAQRKFGKIADLKARLLKDMRMLKKTIKKEE